MKILLLLLRIMIVMGIQWHLGMRGKARLYSPASSVDKVQSSYGHGRSSALSRELYLISFTEDSFCVLGWLRGCLGTDRRFN